MKENDICRLSVSIEATVIGEARKIILPSDTVATIVLVIGEQGSPVAYEIEAFLPDEGIYVLATVGANECVKIK